MPASSASTLVENDPALAGRQFQPTRSVTRAGTIVSSYTMSYSAGPSAQKRTEPLEVVTIGFVRLVTPVSATKMSTSEPATSDAPRGTTDALTPARATTCKVAASGRAIVVS